MHTTVAQLQAQLDDAKWNLSQTTVRAPADGYVTAVGLSVGDRALQHSSVLSFIIADQVKIVHVFAEWEYWKKHRDLYKYQHEPDEQGLYRCSKPRILNAPTSHALTRGRGSNAATI